MKYAFISGISFLVLMSIATLSDAQEDKSRRPSPPAEIRGTVDSADIAIYYSSPAVKGRIIWGGLVPYGKVWRTGANEATVFETNRAVLIQGQLLPPGKYALFTIPGEEEWTYIFNGEWNQWGAFKYDNTKDVLRIKVPVQKSPAFNERMKFEFIDDNIVLLWENIHVGFPVSLPSID